MQPRHLSYTVLGMSEGASYGNRLLEPVLHARKMLCAAIAKHLLVAGGGSDMGELLRARTHAGVW